MVFIRKGKGGREIERETEERNKDKRAGGAGRKVKGGVV